MSSDESAHSVDRCTQAAELRPHIEKLLVCKKTAHQELILGHSPSFGKCLFLDGEIQSAQADEFIYHEALVHPALLAHPEPERVLIIGGGEGATLREVLRRRGVKRVWMVDIDREVVEFSKNHLPEWHEGSFDDGRCEVVFADARDYVAQTDQIYDVVVSDLPSPAEGGPAWRLYTLEFYEIVKSKLDPRGILALQAGCGSLGSVELLKALHHTLQRIFKLILPYREFIPSFEDSWAFILSSDLYHPERISAKEIDSLIASQVEGELRFYDGITHEGMFRIPKHLRKALEDGEIITDSHPRFSTLTS